MPQKYQFYTVDNVKETTMQCIEHKTVLLMDIQFIQAVIPYSDD